MSFVLLDGASGTRLWDKAEAAGLEKLPVWQYNTLHPELVEQVQAEYVAAGSEILLTNTFGANGPSVEKAAGFTVEQVVKSGVQIARSVAGNGVKCALSAGPLSQLMEPYGDLEEDQVAAIYDEMFAAGAAAGADCIWLETFMDLAMLAVAARSARKYELPVFCTMTFEGERTLMGNTVEQIAKTLAEAGVSGVGLNCSSGPAQALPVMEAFHRVTDLPLIFKPNAGLPVTAPDGTVTAAYTASDFVREIAPALSFVSYVGGCCGTDPEYIRLLAQSR